MELSGFKSWQDRLAGVYDELQKGVLAGMAAHACDPEVMEREISACVGDLRRSAFEIGCKRGRRLAPPKPAFVPKPPKVVIQHALRREFKTTAEALVAGRYPDGPDSGVTDETYPLRPGMQGQVDLFGLDINESFPTYHEPSTTELVAIFAAYGFERPVYEDGLRDGGEYPDESYDDSHVYLHEPDADGGVLVRGGWFGGRSIGRDFNGSDFCWDRDCLFFVRRRSV